MKNLVSPEYLFDNINKVVIIDATNNFMIPTEGIEKYKARHIPGAFHIDLRNDMSREVTEHGGRDPLPHNMEDFKAKLEEYGISTGSEIIVYDEDIVPASRFWWMCKYIGLDNVRLLDGGINAWIENGFSLSAVVPSLPQRGNIEMKFDSEIIADIDDIRRAINDEQVLIIDSRSSVRYKGEEEPIDKKAGHIPTAKNYFYEGVLEQDGKYRRPGYLKEHFKGVEKYKEVICQCGSGVSAPVNIIALDEIGIKAKLYVGSWSDYITYDDSLIAVGEQ
ncbi:MAG: sulfurtransferase [Proteocatella sp.]